MPKLTEFQAAVVGQYGPLMRYAFLLTKDRDDAEDLAQDTLMRALAHEARFQADQTIEDRPGGSAMRAWLFTICRNAFLARVRGSWSRLQKEMGGGRSGYRLRWREELSLDGTLPDVITMPSQEGHVDHGKLVQAMERLKPEHRQAIELLSFEDLTYEDASARTGLPVGTMKSRMNRARSALQREMGIDPAQLHTDAIMASAMQGGTHGNVD